MKSVILLSGGFDSVVLAHFVAKVKEEPVVGIFCDYGQSFGDKEWEKACDCINRLRAEGYDVELIYLDLQGEINVTEDASNYVPMRNLIFIAHAARIAEKNGYKKIYAGFIDPGGNEAHYPDTSVNFTTNVNVMLSDFDIEFDAPFVQMQKEEVGMLANYLGVDVSETWSCMEPIENEDTGELERCGKCSNCEFFYNFYESTVTLPDMEWYRNGFAYSERFRKLFMEAPIEEARLVINNVCNMNCKHCYYQLDKCGELLTLDDWKAVIKKCANMGVTHINFTGKEPLINGDVLELARFIRKEVPGLTFSMTTNGLNLKRYIDQIAELGFTDVRISFDDFDEFNIRPTSDFRFNLGILDIHRVPYTVLITVSKSNIDKVANNIRTLNSYGARKFWINTIIPVGNAEDIIEDMITPEQYLNLFHELCDLDLYNSEIVFDVEAGYLDGMLEYEDEDFEDAVHYHLTTGDDRVTDCVRINLELHCERYLSSITIAPDGEVVGCGIELSNPDYAKNTSAGNVMYDSLEKIIQRGKQRTISYILDALLCPQDNACGICGGVCPHAKFCYKMGCKME